MTAFVRAATAILVLLSLACSGRNRSASAGEESLVRGRPSTNIRHGRVADFEATVDYFPDKVSVAYAEQFRVEYHSNFKVVAFRSKVTGETRDYLLSQRGTPIPAGYPRALPIEIPIRRFAITDYRYDSAIEAFGIERQLVGIGNARVVTTPKIKQLLEQRRIRELNPDSGLNLEETVASHVDVVFTYYSSVSAGNIHAKLDEAKLPAVPLADDQEQTPLGRSEWIKFFALFFNAESDAEHLFQPAGSRYEELAAQATALQNRPLVLANYAQRDVWNVYGGRHAFARIVADAGGAYIWSKELAAGYVELTFEQASHQAQAADVWILGPGFGRAGIADVLRRDSRIRSFPAWRSHRTFACAALTPDGRNPYWDQALTVPDVELADMIRMLHPKLKPEHPLRFYVPIN